MEQSTFGHEPDELGYGAWIAFWAQLAVLAFVVVFGAVVASNNAAPGDYASGLTLSLTAVGLAFLRVKSRFDGEPGGWGDFLLVDDMMNLVAEIVVLGVLALAGLFLAASAATGPLHAAGLALFVACALLVFFSIKHVFDAAEGRG
jgi:hypothetical protein